MVKQIENYVLTEVVGEGSFGKVYKAYNKIKPGEFAVKLIPVDKFTSCPKLEETTMNQVEILGNIGNCQYIVHYYEMLKTKNNYYFVYQYCNGGNLLQKIKKQKLPEPQAIQLFLQILEAFKVLNKMNIMHRDLKPENIFLHNGKAKLGDFGFCKGLKPDESMAKTMLGSPIYMAPETLRGDSYTTKADVWPLGVIFYQMLYGKCPFESSSIAKLINMINQSVSIDFPEQPPVSENTKNLIRKMLVKDYYRRIGWVQLFNYSRTLKSSDTTSDLDNHNLKKNQKQITFEAEKPEAPVRASLINGDEFLAPIDKSLKMHEKPASMPKYPQKHGIFNSQNYTKAMATLTPYKDKKLEAGRSLQDFSPLRKKFLDQYLKDKDKCKDQYDDAERNNYIKGEEFQKKYKDMKDQYGSKEFGKKQPYEKDNYQAEKEYQNFRQYEKEKIANRDQTDVRTDFKSQKNSPEALEIKQLPSDKRLRKVSLHGYIRAQDQHQIPLNDNSPDNSKPRLSEPPKLESSPIRSKRSVLLNKHSRIVTVLKGVMPLLEKSKPNQKKLYGSEDILKGFDNSNPGMPHQFLVPLLYRTLSTIQTQLKEMTGAIKIAEVELLDIASLLNYEIIQVDRVLTQIKEVKLVGYNRDLELQNIQGTVQWLDSSLSQCPEAQTICNYINSTRAVA